MLWAGNWSRAITGPRIASTRDSRRSSDCGRRCWPPPRGKAPDWRRPRSSSSSTEASRISRFGSAKSRASYSAKIMVNLSINYYYFQLCSYFYYYYWLLLSLFNDVIINWVFFLVIWTGKDLTSVQNLQKKHALLEADVTSHQDRIDAIKLAAQQFVDSGHFDVDSIVTKQVVQSIHPQLNWGQNISQNDQTF